MRQWLAFCLPSLADRGRPSPGVFALNFPASCTGEDVSAPWSWLALCFLGSVTTAYNGFREGMPSSSFRGHSEMSTPIAPICLRDASHQPGKVALTLWEWCIGQPPKPQNSGKELLLEANTKQRSQTFLVDTNQEMPKVNKCFFYLFRWLFQYEGVWSFTSSLSIFFLSLPWWVLSP